MTLCIAFALPEIIAIGMSFTDASPGYATKFTGLANYSSILTDPEFWSALGRTGIFLVSVVVAQLICGVGIATLVARNFNHRAVIIGIILAPMGISAAVLGPMWKYIFSEQSGLVNYVLAKFGLGSVPWFSSPTAAMVVIIIVRLWIAIPGMFILIYPAVINVPIDYYEAARIDGASAYRQFRSITLPSIAPALRVAAIFAVIWTFGVFGEIFVLTQGGPLNGTETIGVYLYNVAFGNFQWGRGAAVGVLVAVFTLAIALPQVRALGKDAAPTRGRALPVAEEAGR